MTSAGAYERCWQNSPLRMRWSWLGCVLVTGPHSHPSRDGPARHAVMNVTVPAPTGADHTHGCDASLGSCYLSGRK